MNLSELKKEVNKKIEKYLSVFGREAFNSYTYIILTLFTVSFFSVAAIGPTLNTVSNLNKQYKDNIVIYSALSEKLNNLKSLDNQYGTLSDDLGSVFAAIPKNAKIPYLTRQVENMAALNDVQISKFNVGSIEIFPNTKSDPIYSFLFSVSVKGERTNVNNFLAELINFDRIVGIEKITSGTDAEKEFNLSFTGRVFFSPN